jgi:hypothetical protein
VHRSLSFAQRRPRDNSNQIGASPSCRPSTTFSPSISMSAASVTLTLALRGESGAREPASPPGFTLVFAALRLWPSPPAPPLPSHHTSSASSYLAIVPPASRMVDRHSAQAGLGRRRPVLSGRRLRPGCEDVERMWGRESVHCSKFPLSAYHWSIFQASILQNGCPPDSHAEPIRKTRPSTRTTGITAHLPSATSMQASSS